MAAWTQHSNGISALTQRQRDVLRLIADGRTNPEIAETLGVSLAGAKWHVSEVLSRLGVESREDAAEIWREENSLPRRFTTLVRGLVGFGGLKLVFGGVAVAGAIVAGVGAIVVFRDLRADGGSEAALTVPALPEFPNAIYTRSQALDVGREMAAEVVARDNRMSRLTFQSRPFSPSDLQVTSHDFFEDAALVDTGMPGRAVDFPTGRNIWTAEFAASGFDTPGGPGNLRVKVMFEDGTTLLLESWMDTPELPLPPGSPPRLTEKIGQFDAAGESWNLVVGENAPTWYLGVEWGEPGVRMTGRAASVEPPIAGTTNEHLIQSDAWIGEGYSVAYGVVSNAVATIELTLGDARVVSVAPQAPPVGSAFPYEVFGWAEAGAATITEVRAYDSNGGLLGTSNP